MKYLKIILVFLVLSSVSVVNVSAQTEYFKQFARNYSNKDLLTDEKKAERFVEEFLKDEGRSHAPGILYNEECGISYDGYTLNPKDGSLIGAPRNWSASSKESLQITLICIALSGSEKGQLFLSPDDPKKATQKAIDILTRKIKTYEKFNREYPRFGGYLPWFLVSDRGITPTWDWQDRVPGLDNGQLVWALVLADYVLEQKGYTELAARYRAYWKLMADNSVEIFFDPPTGRIRAETKITKNADGEFVYTNNMEGYMLDDPYEGEMLALFMSLFGKWKNPSDIETIWKNKHLNKAVYKTKDGHEITVREGHWYSAHEMWNFLILPYLNDPLIKEIYDLGEVARTIHLAEQGIPGSYASVNPPPKSIEDGIYYISATGIDSISKEVVEYTHVVTPYGAFPIIVTDLPMGLVWLKTMIDAPKMQGPFGTTEATTITGDKVAPYITWDAKMTTVLSTMQKESIALMTKALKANGVYDKMMFYIHRKYSQTFGTSADLKGKNLKLAAPSTVIPKVIPDFEVVDKNADTDALAGTDFIGEGYLSSSYFRYTESNALFIPKGTGYIWNYMTPTDISKKPFINFRVKTKGGRGKGLYIELKNKKGDKITQEKVRVEFPGTHEVEKVFSLNIEPLLSVTSEEAVAALFSISDPDIDMQITEIVFSKKPSKRSEMLKFDGRRFIIETAHINKLPNAVNIASAINLKPGGAIDFVQDDTLEMYTSLGWLWGKLPDDPQIDIVKNPIIYMTVKTKGRSGFDLELKAIINGKEEPLVSDKNADRMHIAIPDTKDKFVKIKVPLKLNRYTEINPVPTVVVIANPTGNMEIAEMRFDKEYINL